jgi:hypothetical protein
LYRYSNKINWNKIDKEKYKSIIDEMLPVNRKQPENKSELEEAYTALNQVWLESHARGCSKEEIVYNLLLRKHYHLGVCR